MKKNKDKDVIKDKDLNQISGGSVNWVSNGGKIVQCNSDCFNQKSDRCNVKNEGMCKYNH